MKQLAVVAGVVVSLLGSTVAFAKAPPKAKTGFQLALRPGIAVPLGDVSEGAEMSDLLGVQFPFTVDIGAKVIPNLFVGAYLGSSVGLPSGDLADVCDFAGKDCLAYGLRLGIQAQYHILPKQRANPWVGYGIGYEWLAITDASDEAGEAIGFGGLEFAHFLAGLDFRLTPIFGVGPFADFSLGSYSTTSDGNDSSDIPRTALHYWLTFGARFVFFP